MYPALGIDYGRVQTGLALADGPLVEPLSAVTTTRLQVVLPQMITRYRIKTLVVGLPDGPLAKQVSAFVTNLRSSFLPSQLQIVCQDETLSTFDAKNSLLHTSPSRRRRKEHSVAAAIILQSWLDSLPASSVKSG